MRKVKVSLQEIIDEIATLKGLPVNMQVNKGRKRIVKYTGVIESIYPSVFTVKIDDPKHLGKLSYSYSDIMCGNVAIKKAAIMPLKSK